MQHASAAPLRCIRSTDHVVLEAKEPGSGGTGAGAGVTLANGITYMFPFGGAESPLESIHCKWDAAIIITSITIEDCNFPKRADGAGGVDVADDDTTAGSWIDEDPSTAFVGTVGAGTTVVNGVVGVPGGAAGGCMFHLGNFGARRGRIKVVVGATGGLLRVWGHGKA